jgi:hypothetical protein
MHRKRVLGVLFGSFFAQANEELGARRGKPRKNEHI